MLGETSRVNQRESNVRRFQSASPLSVAAAICLSILVVALTASPAFFHWFLIPVFACGLLCCIDAVQVLQYDRRNVFDPVALLGAFGVFFFYIGPLLHVGRDYWFINPRFAPSDRPDDWRPWLGWMGILNFVGLVIYRICRKHFAPSVNGSQVTGAYRTSRLALLIGGYPLLVLALLLQMYIYMRFGGLTGYIDTFAHAAPGEGFVGLGWVLCIAESFPILLLVVMVERGKHKLRDLTTLQLGPIFAALLILCLFFGGLRGSRSNTVISLAFAVGIIHTVVKKLPLRFFAMFGVAVVAFMYIFGFYKISPETFRLAITSSEDRAAVAQSTGRNLDAVLLADFERSDIQAYLLFRIMQEGRDIKYAYGTTYLDGLLGFIPHAISSYRPPGKLKYGTEMIFGPGTYSEGRFASTKVYGLAGEAMLNFGPWGVPLAFGVLGIVVGRLRAFARRIEPSDSRQYMLPILALLCCIALSCDLDNVTYNALEHALMPGLLIWCTSGRAVSTIKPMVAGKLQSKAKVGFWL
jgi:hypothetical protein